MRPASLVQAAGLAGLVLSTTACFSSVLTFTNQTGRTLTPYPVVTDPPPPHRVGDAANSLPHGQSTDLDTDGFNPVYYTGGVGDEAQANGLYLGLDTHDDTPPVILWRLFHYRVPPGQEDLDPALQPILLGEGLLEFADVDQDLRVRSAPISPTEPPVNGGWIVTLTPKS